MPRLGPIPSANEPKWLIYQKAVAALEESFGNCLVEHDILRRGRRSGVDRQVDIWLSVTLGNGHPITVAVECKCYEKNPVGIKDVDAFYGFLDDVGANKGVLISNSGFTEGAKKRADGSTLELNTLELDEAEDFDWAEFVEPDRCQTDGFPCVGCVNWEFDDGHGGRAGFCDGCGNFHVSCGVCEQHDVYDGRLFKCYGCSAKWRLEEHKGEVIGFYRTDIDEDNDE